jgi:predicted amidohydrolase YtcJ
MRHVVIIGLGVLLVGGCSRPGPAVEPAEAIYSGGDILTMAGESPEYVEALAVRDGRIAFAGTRAGAEALAGPATRRIDLGGHTLLPGFIDAHGHIWNTGVQASSANLLPPPDGEGTDIAALVRLARDWAARNPQAIATSGVVFGFGYDDSQLKEQRHPTADDLDKVSADTPVLFVHQSGHLGVMNHKALAAAGYDADTSDPPGGTIRRVEGSRRPNGVVEGIAVFAPLFKLMSSLGGAANEALAKAGVAAYVSHGFTTAQEGRATRAAAETWRTLAGRGELPIDVVVYPDLPAELEFMRTVGASRTYQNGFRIGGAKINLDGSPQGRTAWLGEPYTVPPPGRPADFRGTPVFADDSALQPLVDAAFEHRWQLLMHNNGDAASDQMIRAVTEAAARFGNDDRRTVAIHAQTVREDQLDAFQKLGIIPSFFGMHTFYWGDWHRDVTLGPERAARISPAQSARRRGMIFTQHHDAPVALPSAVVVLDAVVNRTTRSGQVLGPEQRLSVYDGLRSLTVWGAYQYFEEADKGTIEVGKLADFVILDRNPLKVEPRVLRDLRVLETIKAGQPIYTANAGREP